MLTQLVKYSPYLRDPTHMRTTLCLRHEHTACYFFLSLIDYLIRAFVPLMFMPK